MKTCDIIVDSSEIAYNNEIAQLVEQVHVTDHPLLRPQLNGPIGGQYRQQVTLYYNNHFCF